MDTAIFWEIIGRYDSHTIVIQILLFLLLVVSFVLSYTGKVKWLVKAVSGVIAIYLGIVFFGYYGTEKIQHYFALPLFMLCGFLFLLESVKNKNDVIEKLNNRQIFFLIMCLLYPIISIVLGNKFPQMTTYIMPCPLISISIVIYSGYRNKNKLLLAALALWGLTGIKAFVANAYEDLILLACGIYCLIILLKPNKVFNRSRNGNTCGN